MQADSSAASHLFHPHLYLSSSSPELKSCYMSPIVKLDSVRSSLAVFSWRLLSPVELSTHLLQTHLLVVKNSCACSVFANTPPS